MSPSLHPFPSGRLNEVVANQGFGFLESTVYCGEMPTEEQSINCNCSQRENYIFFEATQGWNTLLFKKLLGSRKRDDTHYTIVLEKLNCLCPLQDPAL